MSICVKHIIIYLFIYYIYSILWTINGLVVDRQVYLLLNIWPLYIKF